MSTSLYWSLIPEEPKEHNIDYLKYAMQAQGENHVDMIVDRELISFLRGIIIGDETGDMSKDAQDLINAIKKHGKVHLFTHG